MATPKQGFALVSYYQNKYESKYGFKPVVNKYKAKYAFVDILDDMSDDELRLLIDYYFETLSTNSHSLDWFFYNYDKLVEAKAKRDTDAAQLVLLREESKRRAEEWRKAHGND